jgi:alpha-tubulin suppressor-like RCC1 family protein
MGTIDVGKIRFNWLGTYSASTTYTKDDVVSYGGTSWVYVNASGASGQTPADNAYWDIMADGTNPMTTEGDMIQGGSSGTATRLPIGSAGNVLKVQSSTAVGWGETSGLEGWVPLGSNIPKYAHTTDSTASIKRPWLAQYNGKSGASADYIPYDGMPNTMCGPSKRSQRHSGGSVDRFLYLNQNNEVVHRGYSNAGDGSTSAQINMMASVVIPISTEFGGLKDGEYFVRLWYKGYSNYALTNKGNVFVNGGNNYNQLGLGDTTNRNGHWVKNPYLGPDATNNSISCEVSTLCLTFDNTGNIDYINCFAILHDGRVLCWGHNASGSLGIGDTTSTGIPELITTLQSVNTVSVIGGYNATIFLIDDGNVWSTGADTTSINAGSARTAPAQYSGIDSVVEITGAFHTSYCSAFALQSDGDMYALGYNGYGQLGLGDTTNRSAWTQTGGSTNFAAAFFDGSSASTVGIALEGVSGDLFDTTTGTNIYLCGFNTYGILMQNNTTHSSAWVQPLTTTYGTSYFKNVTASADGTATTTNITFPRTKIKAVYPAEQYAGYTGLLMVDDQDRMWYSGYFYYNYGYQANTTSLTTLSLAFPYPSPWNHNLSSGSKFAGNSQVTIEDIYCQKSVGTTVYHNYFLRDSAGGIWYHGEQYHNMGGAGATGPKVHWARLGTS